MPVRSRKRSALAAAGLVALTSIALGAVPVSAAGPDPSSTADGGHGRHQGDLRRAYEATERYRSEQAALDDGYLRTDECVFSDEGGMGYHYVKPAHIGSTDPTRPAALLYADTHHAAGDGKEHGQGQGQAQGKEQATPQAQGKPQGKEQAKPQDKGQGKEQAKPQDKGQGKDGRRLVALEWVVPNTGQAQPEIFGRGFDGPEVIPGVGDVYSLHAWIFKKNPKGVFAPYNPRVTCPAPRPTPQPTR
ncbi:hypothetical protein [Streptomyces sp. NPDC053755]|uniref:hypothetical protein n=1 Tax=Streptomyces sp. NPDC053755 TaxID=3155815 RepID=UPI00342CBADA